VFISTFKPSITLRCASFGYLPFLWLCDIFALNLIGVHSCVCFCKICAQKCNDWTSVAPSWETRDAFISVCESTLAQLIDGSQVGPQETCEMPQKCPKSEKCVKISLG
jgi:hypothetical protein